MASKALAWGLILEIALGSVGGRYGVRNAEAVMNSTTNALNIDTSNLSSTISDCNSFCEDLTGVAGNGWGGAEKSGDGDTDGYNTTDGFNDDGVWNEKDDEMCGALGSPTSASYGTTAIPSPTASSSSCNLPDEVLTASGQTSCDVANKMLIVCKLKNTEVESQCKAHQLASQANNWQKVLAALDYVVAAACTTVCVAEKVPFLAAAGPALEQACSIGACVAKSADLAGQIALTINKATQGGDVGIQEVASLGMGGISLISLIGDMVDKKGFCQLGAFNDLNPGKVRPSRSKYFADPDTLLRRDQVLFVFLQLHPIFLALQTPEIWRGLAPGDRSELASLIDSTGLFPKVAWGEGFPAGWKMGDPIPSLLDDRTPTATNVGAGGGTEPDTANDADAAKRKEACGTAALMALLAGLRTWALVGNQSTAKKACEQVQSLWSSSQVVDPNGSPDLNNTNWTAMNGTSGGNTSSSGSSTSGDGSSSDGAVTDDNITGLLGGQSQAAEAGILKPSGLGNMLAKPASDLLNSGAFKNAGPSTPGNVAAALGGLAGPAASDIGRIADAAYRNANKFGDLGVSGTAYALSGGKSSSGGAGAGSSSPFGGLFGGGPTASGFGGPKGMDFGDGRGLASENDIFHSNTDKNIFQIVSGRIEKVAPRLMEK